MFCAIAKQVVIRLSLIQVLTDKQHHQAAKNEYNFDHPDAFDFELLRKTLQRLKHFKSVEVPIYNFITHSRETKTVCTPYLTLLI